MYGSWTMGGAVTMHRLSVAMIRKLEETSFTPCATVECRVTHSVMLGIASKDLCKESHNH